jgi:hypothetical protein
MSKKRDIPSLINNLRPSNNLSERSTANFWFSGDEKSTNANLSSAPFIRG